MCEIVHSETCSIQSMEIAWLSEVAAVGALVPQMKTRGTSVYSDGELPIRRAFPSVSVVFIKALFLKLKVSWYLVTCLSWL
jgi:hypothetical protein